MSCSKPWVLMGDFNAMVDSTEKRGGAKFYQSHAAYFRECIRGCNLIDIGFVDQKFTWFCRNLRERLDRCLGNVEWSTLFPDAATCHLERLKSDHRPLLVRTNKSPRFLRSSVSFGTKMFSATSSNEKDISRTGSDNWSLRTK